MTADNDPKIDSQQEPPIFSAVLTPHRSLGPKGFLVLMAVLCGIMAIVEIRRNPKVHGMGRAIFGIVMGSIGSLVMAIALFAAIMKR